MRLERVERYYNFHAAVYDWTRPFYLLDRKKAVDKLGVRDGATVVDVACGTGMNIPHLLKNKLTVVGIDYSTAMLARAMRKYPAIRFIHADVATHRFEEQFDAALCTYAMSLIEDWQRAILNIKDALRIGGRLVILDFHRWQSRGKILYPTFRWWLKLHGVNPEIDVSPFLHVHFTDVEISVKQSGYNYIASATKSV